jgi:hypothetical protein
MICIDVQRDQKFWYVSRFIERDLGGGQAGTVLRRLPRSQRVGKLGELISQMLGLPARPRKVHFETQTSWPLFDSKATYATVELINDQLTIVPLKVTAPFGANLVGDLECTVLVSANSSADEIGAAIDRALSLCCQPAERGSPRHMQQMPARMGAPIQPKFGVGNRLEFVNTLDSLGFFKFTSPENIESTKREFERTGLVAIYGETGRMFHADAENLSQGGVGKFLRRIKPLLAALGVVLNRIIEHFDNDGYRVTVNEWIYDIWFDSDKLDPWVMSTIRTFQLVNDLLAQARADERMYAVNSGNDLSAYFLTPDLFEVICNHHEYRIRDYPYVPSEAANR